MTTLNPTLWRTVRALNNPDRLRLLKLVYESDQTKCVVNLAQAADLDLPVASNYLRALNARGLISVKRIGRFVLYGSDPDRSLPISMALQSAFKEMFTGTLSAEWEQKLLPTLMAFAHPRREQLIRLLKQHKELHFAEFLNLSKFSKDTFIRHLHYLLNAAVAAKTDDGKYQILSPQNSIAEILIRAI